MQIPYQMFQPIVMFELNGKVCSMGSGEYADPKAAKGAMIRELQEGINLGLTPVRGVLVEKRGNDDFCSHVFPVVL